MSDPASVCRVRDCRHTWHAFDVVGRMHGHHLGVNPYSILAIRIQTRRDLDERQRRSGIWVKVRFDRIRALVNVEVVGRHRCVDDEMRIV